MHGASRVLLISDGFSGDDAARGHLLELMRRAEVLVLIVADPIEMALPPPGRYPLAHGGDHFDVVLEGDRQREDFLRKLSSGRDRLAALADSMGLRQRIIDTTADPMEAVASLLGGNRR
jgi:hypothetical protein